MFISAQGIEQQSSELKRILMRSCFHTVPVQQLVSGFKSTSSGGAWRPSAEVKRVVESRSRCIISSGLVEEVHNFQKNLSQSRGSMRFRRPERAMAVAWGRKVVSVRHNYQEVEPRVPVMRKSLRLDSNAFAKKATATTVDLSGICSTVSTPHGFHQALPTQGCPPQTCRFSERPSRMASGTSAAASWVVSHRRGTRC